jgi:hypothetical protein
MIPPFDEATKTRSSEIPESNASKVKVDRYVVRRIFSSYKTVTQRGIPIPVLGSD